MKVRVLAFARIREIVGAAATDRNVVSDATVGDVWADLGCEFPALVPLRESTRFARNGALVPASQTLADDDELALLPPFGGG